MKLSEKLKTNRLAIIQIAEANNTLYPRIIRNYLPEYELDGLHVDIVVDRTSEFMPSDIGNIQQQLEDLLGVSVEVVTPNLLPNDQRERILAESIVI